MADNNFTYFIRGDSRAFLKLAANINLMDAKMVLQFELIYMNKNRLKYFILSSNLILFIICIKNGDRKQL